MTIEDVIRQAVRDEIASAFERAQPDVPALMDAAKAARYLSLSRSSLMKRSGDGEIPSRLIDGRRYWSRADLDTWIATLPAGSALRKRRKAV